MQNPVAEALDARTGVGRVEGRQQNGEVVFSLAYLESIVDTRLGRAVEALIRAASATSPMLRTEYFGMARADYGVAHAIASLVDDRCYDANEWPVFTAWASELMRAARAF